MYPNQTRVVVCDANYIMRRMETDTRRNPRTGSSNVYTQSVTGLRSSMPENGRLSSVAFPAKNVGWKHEGR